MNVIAVNVVDFRYSHFKCLLYCVNISKRFQRNEAWMFSFYHLQKMSVKMFNF